MKIVKLKSDIVIEISEGEKLFSFAQKILDNGLYVKGFSLRSTLTGLINCFKCEDSCSNVINEDRDYVLEKTKDSFICLLKKGDEYIGMCAFFKFHPCTIQTFIKNDFRGKGIAFDVIKEVVMIVKEKGFVRKISFHHGEAQSLILFYKLWENNLINLYNIVNEENKRKLRYINAKIKGRNASCFLNENESRIIGRYIEKRKVVNCENEKLLIGEVA